MKLETGLDLILVMLYDMPMNVLRRNDDAMKGKCRQPKYFKTFLR